MSTVKLTKLMVVALTGFFIFGSVYAEEKNKNTQSQGQNTDSQAPKADEGLMKMGDKGSMMGNMNMDGMKGMMHECMQMHKDGKMCDRQMMGKCEEKMGKDECKKMMKQAKAKQKTEE